MNENAEVLEEWFGKTVILSDRRFNYAEAQEIIESGQGEYSNEVNHLHNLATILREKRYKNGSINFIGTDTVNNCQYKSN